MYFLRSISDEVRLAKLVIHKHTKTKRLVLGSLFSCFAAILQAAGGFLPGIGYFFSPLATAPILICSMFSLPVGVISYLLTILLLLIIQPSELIMFPFTTGLLGLGIGAAFFFCRKRLSIISFGAVLLTLGIILLLFVFRIPVLGPTVSDSFSFVKFGNIFLFTFCYSWLWVEISLILFKRLNRL